MHPPARPPARGRRAGRVRPKSATAIPHTTRALPGVVSTTTEYRLQGTGLEATRGGGGGGGGGHSSSTFGVPQRGGKGGGGSGRPGSAHGLPPHMRPSYPGPADPGAGMSGPLGASRQELDLRQL